MNNSQNLLPGGFHQLTLLEKTLDKNFEKILVIGESSEKIVTNLLVKYQSHIEYIVEDYESLLNAKLILGSDSQVIPKLMDFEKTDFQSNTFDLIFAQASLSRENRKEIIREIKRILTHGGIFAIGEIVTLTQNPPRMIQDMLNWAGIVPLHINEIENYYKMKNFEIIAQKTFHKALPEYYRKIKTLFESKKDNLTEQEKSYYKKLINRINHEANLFTKFGGEKHIVFHSIIAKNIN